MSERSIVLWYLVAVSVVVCIGGAYLGELSGLHHARKEVAGIAAFRNVPLSDAQIESFIDQVRERAGVGTAQAADIVAGFLRKKDSSAQSIQTLIDQLNADVRPDRR